MFCSKTHLIYFSPKKNMYITFLWWGNPSEPCPFFLLSSRTCIEWANECSPLFKYSFKNVLGKTYLYFSSIFVGLKNNFNFFQTYYIFFFNFWEFTMAQYDQYLTLVNAIKPCIIGPTSRSKKNEQASPPPLQNHKANNPTLPCQPTTRSVFQSWIICRVLKKN